MSDCGESDLEETMNAYEGLHMKNSLLLKKSAVLNNCSMLTEALPMGGRQVCSEFVP